MPVELFNPFQRIAPPAEGTGAELIEQNAGQLAVAVGLALRSFERPMIRINLLEAPKPKSKRSAHAVNADHGSRRRRLTAGQGPDRVLDLAAAFNLGYWYHLDTQKNDIATKMAQAEQKNRELADVKPRYLARQREAENYKRRVDVIDQLRKNQAGPVTLMAMVGETVNNTEAVWLEQPEGSGRERRYRGHGVEHRCGGEPDLQPAEDGISSGTSRSRKAFRTRRSKTCRRFSSR